jgi:hypothetical protein
VKGLRDDLFAIFPDLPGIRHRTPEEQIRKVHQQVADTRERARANIGRQKANAARMQERIADRKRRRFLFQEGKTDSFR